jgi:hypothetical protein
LGKFLKDKTGYKMALKNIVLICLVILAACTTSKNINHVAKKEGLTVRTVAGIKLSGGIITIDSLPRSSKDEPVYLLYSGDELRYLSTEKRVVNGEFMYLVQKIGDSMYMLTRRSHFPRYFYEDTVLFHHNYVVSNRYLYDGNATNKGNIVQDYFHSYHFTADSLVEFSSEGPKPFPSIFDYGSNLALTENFIRQSTQRKLAKCREEDLVREIRH